MLEDIVALTNYTIEDSLVAHKNDMDGAKVYSVYKKLANLISSAKITANHYLVLDFSEGYLQNSSFGAPADKWRYVFNKDLEELNKCAKKLLLKLRYLCYETDGNTYDSFLFRYYNHKTYYGYVRDQYSVGFLQPCGFIMNYCILDTDFKKEESEYIGRYGKLDLTEFCDREALKANILQNCNELEKQLSLIKVFLVQNFTIEDLV
ncbi:MAG: hypothetical protein JHC37_05830 [Campylobacteraceae bacterium]|jgi:hypothetical protein|nr:hypothetical protein [Campylobacteraceae bacterium]